MEEAGGSLQPLDPESINCMGCHDGAVGRFADSAIHGTPEGQQGSSIGVTHPVGVPYQEAAASTKDLRPVGSLDQMIRLYSGTLGCGTCHSVYAKHIKYLVMDNQGSRLCTACHSLQGWLPTSQDLLAASPRCDDGHGGARHCYLSTSVRCEPSRGR